MKFQLFIFVSLFAGQALAAGIDVYGIDGIYTQRINQNIDQEINESFQFLNRENVSPERLSKNLWYLFKDLELGSNTRGTGYEYLLERFEVLSSDYSEGFQQTVSLFTEEVRSYEKPNRFKRFLSACSQLLTK